MKNIIFCLLLLFPVAGYAQYVRFDKDSIPVINGKVVFKVHFKLKLSKEEFHKRTQSYLNTDFKPYSAQFIVDNENKTIYLITDYLNVEKSFLQVFGMYMSYRIEFKYNKNSCMMSIRNISYMGKRYYESTKSNQSKRDRIPVYSAKQIMIGHEFHLMSIKKTSERITKASIKRINAILKGLYSCYANE